LKKLKILINFDQIDCNKYKIFYILYFNASLEEHLFIYLNVKYVSGLFKFFITFLWN